MKDLNEILVTNNGLRLLIGHEITTAMYIKLLKKTIYIHATDRELSKMKFSLMALIKTKGLPKTKSLDKRYDKKEIISFTVEKIRANGLNYNLRDKIYNSKPCIKKNDLCGQYLFLKQILTPDQLAEIKTKLALVAGQVQQNIEL